MDQVAIRALEVNPLQLMVIGMALLALAIVLLAWLGFSAVMKLVGVMQSQVNSNTELTAATVKQTDALRREQDLREAQIIASTAASKAIADAVQTHDGRSDERADKLLNKIDGITDLVGEKISAGTERMMEALKPLTDGLREIRDSLEAAKLESREQQRKNAEIFSAIEEKVELVSEQFIDVVQIFGEISDEEQHKSVGGDDTSGKRVSVGSDASGSANGTGTDSSDGGSATADG